MAEALREFQNRLNQRFLSVQATGVAASWLAVESGQDGVLFPLNHAGEIFPWTHVQRVPHAKPWFLGVSNLRGNLFGVIDLAQFLHIDSAPGADGAKPRDARTDSDLAQCRLVALNPLLEAGCALLVDRLLGLRTLESFTHSEAPPAGSPDYCGHVYIDAQGRRWREINLQHLALDPEFLGIGV
jgi:twitching motility protein PilI